MEKCTKMYTYDTDLHIYLYMYNNNFHRNYHSYVLLRREQEIWFSVNRQVGLVEKRRKFIFVR